MLNSGWSVVHRAHHDTEQCGRGRFAIVEFVRKVQRCAKRRLERCRVSVIVLNFRTDTVIHSQSETQNYERTEPGTVPSESYRLERS